MDINQKLREAKEKMQEATDEYNRLLSEQETFNQLPDKYKLAELIHEKTCHLNHIDQCAFFYDRWLPIQTQSGEKAKYARIAGSILEVVNYDVAVKVISKL